MVVHRRPSVVKPTSGQLPTSCCPVCRYEMDCATHTGSWPATPSPGDLSLCLNCGEMLEFNDILVLQPLPPEAFTLLPEEEKATLLRASGLIKQRGRFK